MTSEPPRMCGVHLPEDIIRHIDKLAYREGISRAAFIRRATFIALDASRKAGDAEVKPA